MSPDRSGYLPTLDGWRAIAILGVIVAHGTFRVVGPGAPHEDLALRALFEYGAKGVDLFFGISGFLITGRLLEEHERRGRVGLSGFYVRRFCRILPPYVALLAFLTACLALGLLPISKRELVASFAFVSNYVGEQWPADWYTGHLWSLAVEEHFYLLWPGLLALLTPRKARWAVVPFALGIAAWRVVEFRLQLVPRFLPDAGFYIRTDTRFDALLWGCFASLMVHHAPARARVERWLTRPVWLLAVGLLVANTLLTPPLALLWQSVLIAVMITGTVLHPGGAVGTLLEHPAARWLGRASYSLYLWQQVFLVALPGVPSFGAVQTLPLNLVALFTVAAASYYLVERPMIRVGHRLAAPVTPGRA